MKDPCAFSPSERQAQRLADFYVQKFLTCGTVLELGFGQGRFLETGRAAGIRTIGIDRDARLVNDATARGLDVRRGDVRNLANIVPEGVDGVFAAHLIEHLEPKEVQELLLAVGRLLSPGGVLVLSTPNFQDWRVAGEWFWLDPTHIRPYPAGAVRQLFDPAQWNWHSDGHEPIVVTRDTAKVLLQRLRFGYEYGHSGRWYRLEKQANCSRSG